MQRRENPISLDSPPPTASETAQGSLRISPVNNDNDWNQSNDIDELTKPLFSTNTSSMSNSTHSSHDDPFRANVGKYKEEMRKRRITSHSSYITHQIVDRLQGIYLSKKMSSYIPVSTNEDWSNGTLQPSGRIPLVMGIDKVVNGTKPASEVVTLCGFKPLRYFWYMISGCKSTY
jgi:hypothetical protein